MKPTGPRPESVIAQLDELREEVQHTKEQHLARARLWMEWRDDPSVALSAMSISQLSFLAREPDLAKWCAKDPSLKAWLTGPREMEERVESLFAQFLEGLEWRRETMSDKDYITAMKLLSEVGNKMPQRWSKERVLDGDVARMNEDQRVKTLVDALTSFGYTVKAPSDPALLEGAPPPEDVPSEP